MNIETIEDFTDEVQELYKKLTELQRQVAWNVLQGMNQTESYKKSNGKAKEDKTIRRSANAIVTNCNVKAFLDLARKEIMIDNIMTREESLSRLSTMGRGNISDLVEFEEYEVLDTEGLKHRQSSWHIKDSAKSDPKQLSNIHKLTAGAGGLKLEIFSPISAIDKMSAMQGWNKPIPLDITSGGKSWGEYCGQGVEPEPESEE